MGLRSLQRRLGRLSATTGLRRCVCGAYLPAEVCKPRPIQITEVHSLPDSLEALLPQATPAEAQELQTLLNRCLELHRDLVERRGTSPLIFGDEPADLPLLRFRFADNDKGGPHCPSCGVAVALEHAVQWIEFMAPPPDDLLDGLRLDPALAARFTELTTFLRHRGDVTAQMEREGNGR